MWSWSNSGNVQWAIRARPSATPDLQSCKSISAQTHILNDALGRADSVAVLELMLCKVDFWNLDVCAIGDSCHCIGAMRKRGRHDGCMRMLCWCAVFRIGVSCGWSPGRVEGKERKRGRGGMRA